MPITTVGRGVLVVFTYLGVALLAAGCRESGQPTPPGALARGPGGPATSSKEAPRHGEFVVASILELALLPERYDGKRVAVKGILSTEYEDTAMYASRDAYDHLLKESVWLVLTRRQVEEFAALNGAWVLAEGTFVSGGSGSFGTFPGRLVDISRIDFHKDRQTVFIEYSQQRRKLGEALRNRPSAPQSAPGSLPR